MKFEILKCNFKVSFSSTAKLFLSALLISSAKDNTKMINDIGTNFGYKNQ